MSAGIFEGRTAVVTGGARGIGKAIVTMLAREGARVAINYERNANAARDTLTQIEAAGGKGMIVQADVSSESDVDRMMALTREQLGPIDLLVNNAGIAETVPHTEVTFASWKRMLDVNLDGTFLTTWCIKDEMIARNYGRIVNVASLAGLVKKKDMIHYATAKAAVIAFTRHCAEAFAAHNVRVKNGQSRPGRQAHRHHPHGPYRSTGRDGLRRTLPPVRRIQLHHRPDAGSLRWPQLTLLFLDSISQSRLHENSR